MSYKLSQLQKSLIGNFNPYLSEGFGFYFCNNDKEIIINSLNKIIKRNPILCSFLKKGDLVNGHIQEIKKDHIDFREKEWSNHKEIIKDELKKPFDLYDSPFFRVILFELSEGRSFFAFVAHPIIVDLQSIRIIKNTLLRQISAKEPEFLRDFWNSEKEDDLLLSEMTPSKHNFFAEKRNFAIPDVVTRKLHNLSSELGVSLELFINTAFSAFIYRFTNCAETLIGSVQNRRKQANAIGVYESLVPIHFKPDMTFLDLVMNNRRKRKSSADKLNSEALVKNVVYFHNEDDLEEELRKGENNHSLFFSQYDMELHIESKKQSLGGYFHFSSDIFNQEIMKWMTKRWIVFLASCVNNPDVLVDDLEIVSKEEQKEILAIESDIKIAIPENIFVIDLFEEQAQKNPDRAALYFGKETLSYKSLNEKANYIAREILNQITTKNPRIVICLDRSLNYAIGVLGILKAGGTFITIDPSSPSERLEMIIRDVEPDFILTEAMLKNKFQRFPDVPIYLMMGSINELSTPIKKTVSSNDNAYILYTSGSTGVPKGIQIKHGSLSNIVLNMQKQTPLTNSDNLLHLLSFVFDVSIINFFWPLTCGAGVILISQPGMHNISYQIDQILRWNCTVISSTPAILQLLLEHLDSLNGCRIRMIRSAGEAFKKNLYEKALSIPGCRVFNDYGPTECTIYSTTYEVTKDTNLPCAPIGKPFANYKAYILDKNLKLVPFGVPGELCICGVGVSDGYLKREQLTKEKFIQNPFDSKSILYRTGDQVRLLPDGNIEFIGRLDFQVKIRGFRVELGEIENALLSFPQINETIVTIYNDEHHGIPHLVAYYTSSNSTLPSTEEFQKFLGEKIPDYMIPSFFVLLEKLPLTINGKIDRTKLPTPKISTTDTKAQTETEKILQKIWKRLLKIESLGTKDNFFELGGDSLLAAEMMFNIEKEIGCKTLSFDQIANNPTITQLASIIDHREMLDKGTFDLCYEDIEKARSVQPAYEKLPRKKELEFILLTGATGFLGVSLLKELLLQTKANIMCLIRGKNPEEKLFRSLQKFLPQEEIDFSRIIFLSGDLSKPLLGLTESEFNHLAENVDSIYHNGALVHHLHGYEYVRESNVFSLIEILKLAGRCKPKPIHFISSANASSDRDILGYIPEAFPILEPGKGRKGYSLSKWVGEKIIQEAIARGFTASVYRLGNILGSTQSGILSYEGNHFSLFLKGCYQMGAAPRMDTDLNLIPVDLSAKLVVLISLQKRYSQQLFNLGLSNTPTYIEIFQIMAKHHYNIDVIDFDKWKELLKNVGKENALYRLVHYYMSLSEPYKSAPMDITKLKQVAKRHGVEIPNLDESYILKNIAYLENWFHDYSESPV